MFWLFRKKEDHKWSKLHKSLKNSFDNIKVDISDIHDNFREKHSHHERRLKEIEEKVGYIMDSIENNRKYGVEDIDEELAIERVQSFNRSNQSFNRSNQSVMNVKSIEKLTPAQREVVILFIYSNKALGYEDIAKSLGLNVVTIRRHVNDMFKIGIPIKEKVDVKNRRKLFYLDKDIKNKIMRSEKVSVGGVRKRY